MGYLLYNILWLITLLLRLCYYYAVAYYYISVLMYGLLLHLRYYGMAYVL
jgi:hypothetical protein